MQFPTSPIPPALDSSESYDPILSRILLATSSVDSTIAMFAHCFGDVMDVCGDGWVGECIW